MVKGPAPFDQGIFLMHLGKGKEYFDKAEYQKAREELEAAYHLRPQDEKVLNLLGMTYFKMEMLPQAEEMYVALSANNPDIYTLQSNLGLIRLKLDKLDQAETALSRALELQPTNPKAHFYLGLLYEKMENWEKALFHFEYARADKMVVRAKERLADQRSRESLVKVGAGVLPFEIVEVLEEEAIDTAHDTGETVLAPAGPLPAPRPPTPPPREEEVRAAGEGAAASGSEWVEHGGSTDKMRRKDVIEAMQRLEEKEAEEEEVLVEDSEVPAVEEPEVVVEHEKAWEKTQPTIKSEAEEAEPEARVTQEIPVTTERFKAQQPSSLFLPEDTAADISTFLAQTRDEGDEEAEDEEFIVEPPVSAPSFAVVPEPVKSAVEKTGEEATVARIPTPDEIENATRDFGSEVIFSKEEGRVVARPAAPASKEEEEELVEERKEEPATAEEEEPEVEVGEKGVLTEAAFVAPPASRLGEDVRVERTIPMQQPLTTDVTAPPSREAAMVEALRPANLDQFSRDRFYIQPLIGADRFLLIDPHLLEVIISDRMIVRKGTISSYTGRVNFTPWANEDMPLVEISGSGILFLADRRKDIFVISLNNESIFVETNHLLVVQSVLKVEPYKLQHGDDVFSTVKISGRGTIAITCQTRPLTLNVYDAMPANIPAEALIAWSGKLTAEVVSDAALYSVMMQPDESGALLRFSGGGDVVVEQGALWGDRRLTK